jgi:hypothetical protein
MDANQTNASSEASTEVKDNSPKLTVNDLQQIALVINESVKRGTFDADEAGAVSALYQKIKSFVGQFEKPKDAVPANNTPESK